MRASSTLTARVVVGVTVMTIFIAFIGAWAMLPELAIESALNAEVEEAVPDVPPLEPIAMSEQRFPLVRSGGIIATSFPNGVPVDMPGKMSVSAPPEVEQMVLAAANAAGLGNWATQLLITEDNDRLRSGQPADYPYRYPYLDSIMAQISDDVIRQHPEELIELSSALLYAARPPAAFSLLRRMQQVENSCPVQANLAAAVALGFNPPQEAVEAEFAKARQLCPDQPVVHAAYAKVRLAFDTRSTRFGAGDSAGYHIGRGGEEAPALAAAREVERLFPTHPLGYATEAAILLELADKYGQAGIRPFTARAMYERSLVLLDALSVAQPYDATVIFGRARALAGLGRPQEAFALAAPLLPTFHDRDARYARDSVRSMLLDLGRPSDAVDLMSTPEGSTDPFDYEAGPASYPEDSTCLSLLPFGDAAFRGTVGDPEPGWGGSCYVTFIDATGNQYPGGADVFDYINYIPVYRGEVPYRGILLVVAGRDEEAEPGMSTEALLMANGRWPDVRPETLTEALERLQDAYRRAGQPAKAEEFLRSALQSGYGHPSHTADRLGEVLYLQGRYREAAEQFAHAAETELIAESWEWGSGSFAADAIGPEWSTVKQAAALYRLGDQDAAERILTDLDTTNANVGYVRPDWDHAALEVARSSLLGTLLLKGQAYEAAVEPLREAVAACDPWRETDLDPCKSGVQFNNLAVTLLRSGQPEDAASVAQLAIAQDPHNPMYVEALANAMEEAGQTGPAIDVYRQAIALDPTQATAHNNLGVLVAQSGNADQAQQHFIAAIRAQPEYAGAWFNLGLSFGTSGEPVDFLRSQGAFARAARGNPAFRDADLEWFSDRQVYDPGLDLSKPLPKDWSAGAQRQPLPLGIVAIVIAVLTLALRHLVTDKLQNSIIDTSLAKKAGQISLQRAGVGDLIGGAVCTAAVAYAVATSLGGGLWQIATGVSLGLLIASVFLALRRALIPAIEHGLSVPGTVVAAAGAVVGIPFVPVPVVGAATRTRTRWVPYLALSGLAVAAALLAWVTGVPVLRLTLNSLVVTLASGLIAVAPLDGTYLGKRVSRFAAALLAVVALALAVHWI